MTTYIPSRAEILSELQRRHMLRRCQEIDRMGAAYLAAHPESPRYCYDCQQWLTNATELPAHPGHSIH